MEIGERKLLINNAQMSLDEIRKNTIGVIKFNDTIFSLVIDYDKESEMAIAARISPFGAISVEFIGIKEKYINRIPDDKDLFTFLNDVFEFGEYIKTLVRLS